jgi:type I restriction enzyme S subunit
LEYGSGASAIEYNGEIRYVRITDINEYGKLCETMVSPSDYNEKYLLNKDDILFARSGATVGKTYIHIYDSKRYIYAGYLIRYIPNTELVYPKYVYYYTKSSRYMNFIELSQRAVAQPNINAKQYSEMLVPLYSKNMQKHIANIFDNTQEIINGHNKQLDELDNLSKAVFYDMFGDPIINNLKWDIVKIEDVAEKSKNAIKAGPFGSALKKEFYIEKGYKIYGQEQVIRDDANYGDYFISEGKYKELENCAVKVSDVLISLVGTYGKLLIIPDEFQEGIINPRLMKITFDKSKIDPIYFKYFFTSESLKSYLSRISRGGTMDIINVGIVKKIEIPIPPLELQTKFAKIVKNIDGQKALVKQSIKESENLFNSLLSKYFD